MTDDRSTTEPTEEAADQASDGSRINKFLQQFESTSEQSTTDPSEPSSTPQRSDETTTSGRLWDSFSSKRTPNGDSDESPPTSPDNSLDEGQQSNPAETVASPESPSESHDSTDATAWSADHASSPEKAADAETSADSPATDDSKTSFRTILERISHRIGSVGFDGSNSGADTASTDHATSKANPSTEETVSPSTAGSTTTGGTTADAPQSDRIEEILHNIDLFGRATSSSQVLLLSPTAHSITNDIYRRFLLPTDGTGQDILFVSATQSGSDQLPMARDIPGWVEGNTGVIEVGQSVLNTSQSSTERNLIAQLDSYKWISNLRHLAKLGINISHIVSQWNSNRRPTVVGIHTLSAVQQYVGNETMFQFLFTLKGQLNSMGVMGFYHMDPAVHTENEISTIQSAFDLVVRIEPDGSVEIL